MNIDEGVVVHFRVLGPLLVEQEGMALSSISALMLRRLLAGMLTRPNECVSVDDLISALWGQSAPPTARRTLLVYIRRLRSALGDEARIVYAPAGYRMVVHDGELDCVEFGHLVSSARAATSKRAANLLSDALKLWRGNAYEDVREHFPIADEARSLDEERVQAEARHAELRLDLGEHAELIPRLTKLVEAHPFNEDFRRHLMLALYRCGRQSDALEVYRSTRLLLDEELGVEPCLALRRLHEAILRSDSALELGRGAAETVIPRELPANIEGFVGRRDHLAKLNTMLLGSSPVVISAIAGSAGVGKTALAVHWAHAVADHYPDGQLYVNLRGFDPVGIPMDPSDVIRKFLNALGVAPQRVPVDAETQISLYRSLAAGKRILVVLDNAHDAEQVRPLLPGSSACLVVVTSRYRLASLVATSGARPLLLDLLSFEEARQLLTLRLGIDRVAAEAEATEEIINQCARLPLALAIAAAHAATDPHLSLTELAIELRRTQSRLDPFDGEDTITSLRTVFSWSYQQLSLDAARLFRLLGLHPGPDFGAHAAASLAGLPLDLARSLLDELTAAHLVVEHRLRRYTFHDLLRAYAREQTIAVDSQADRHIALHRMFDHYLHVAHRADGLLNPKRVPITLEPSQSGCCMIGLDDHDRATDWFDDERHNLLAACQNAADIGFNTHAWQIPWALTTFVERQGHWQDWAASQHVALTAAEALNDKNAQAKALLLLGAAYNQMHQEDEAQQHFRRALDLHQQLDNYAGQAHVHNNLALILARQQRYPEAIAHAQHVVRLHEVTGNREYLARAINAVGWYHGLAGDYHQALAYCQDSLVRQQELGDLDGESSTWDSMGYIYHHLGDHDQSVACYQRSIEMNNSLGHRYYHADTLVHLGDVHYDAGDHDSALISWQQAADAFAELSHPDATEVLKKIERLNEERSILVANKDNES